MPDCQRKVLVRALTAQRVEVGSICVPAVVRVVSPTRCVGAVSINFIVRWQQLSLVDSGASCIGQRVVGRIDVLVAVVTWSSACPCASDKRRAPKVVPKVLAHCVFAVVFHLPFSLVMVHPTFGTICHVAFCGAHAARSHRASIATISSIRCTAREPTRFIVHSSRHAFPTVFKPVGRGKDEGVVSSTEYALKEHECKKEGSKPSSAFRVRVSRGVQMETALTSQIKRNIEQMRMHASECASIR